LNRPLAKVNDGIRMRSVRDIPVGVEVLEGNSLWSGGFRGKFPLEWRL